MSLLEYERSILVDIHNTSCMLVCAEGLDLDNIIYTLIKLHSDPHNLILVSNYSLDEAKYITSKLILENETYCPFIITAEVSVKERSSAYYRGGVVFVSSRILVVDLLRGTMPVNIVTGVFVLRSHRLHEASQESFMIRLLREKNPKIFVQSFTDNAVALMSGYNRVESVMNQFGMSKLLLWPRFNADVVNTLSSCAPKVEEIRIFLSDKTTVCQSCLLEMIKATLRELVENNPILNNDEFSLETALTSAFNQLTSLYIDPVWHQLSQTSHRLLADVASLRCLLFQLINNDAVSFLDSLESLRLAELSAAKLDQGKGSTRLILGQRTCANWLLLSQAEKLLVVARQRVYENYKSRTYSVELSPKLETLSSILDNILTGCKKLKSKKTVLILTNRKRTAEMIEYYLKEGKSRLADWLVRGRMEYEHPSNRLLSGSEEESSLPQNIAPSAIHKRSTRRVTYTQQGNGRHVISCYNALISSSENSKIIGKTFDKKSTGISLGENLTPKECSESTQRVIKSNEVDKKGQDTKESFTSLDLPPGCQTLLYPTSSTEPQVQLVIRVPPPGSREKGAPVAVDLHSINGPAGRLSVVLSQLQPSHILFFEPQVAWIREVEVFAARQRNRSSENERKEQEDEVTVHFMTFKDSVEEQQYLTSLRREREAFENLIRLRSSIVIQKMESVVPIGDCDDLSSSSVAQNVPCVLVDVREFRSELPALLHRKGIIVNPITLSVGDYIIAPHICVERKSVIDLISSLNSGRLYQQCMSMSRHYLNPVLLIEFTMPANGIDRSSRFQNITPTGSFALFTGRNAVLPSSSNLNFDLGPRHLMSKLVLLTVHFPSLRILWSVTPYCTAELFTELKLGRAEPTVNQLPREGENLGQDNIEAVDMLLNMPGISWRNYQQVLAQVNSLEDLANCSLGCLTNILSNQDCAQKLHDFLHSEWSPTVDAIAIVDSKRPKLTLAGRVTTHRGSGDGTYTLH